MNKTNVTVANTTGTSTLTRAKFGPGMLLQHEDLEQLNTYTRDLSRLLFRSFFGCGVICGLIVKAEVDNCNKVSVTVGAGLALNCLGDPVHVPQTQRLVVDKDCYPDLPDKLWVVLCGTTKNCAPRTSMCSDDDDKTTSACTRERGMFEIRVVSTSPKCVCGCDVSNDYTEQEIMEVTEDKCKCADPNLPCYKPHYDGMCGCNCGSGSDCGCDCILLARLDKAATEAKWTVDHRVRRFIRPVLMRDPQAEIEEQTRQYTKKKENRASAEAALSKAIRDASQSANIAAEEARKAKIKANERDLKLAAAQTAVEARDEADRVASDKSVVADNANAAADTAKKAIGKAKTAADKTTAEAAAKIAADAAQTAVDEKTEADRVAAEKRAIAETVQAEADAAKDGAAQAQAKADAAENSKLAANEAVTDTRKKVAALERELASFEARDPLRFQ